jgi:ADP-heptose:LPS heptosyltransferase
VIARILAVRLRALGDVVLTTPALRALNRGYPGVPIEVVTERRYAALLEGLPGIERVWAIDRSTVETARLTATLARRDFGLAVDFFGNPRSALIASRSGAPRVAGYDLRGRSAAYHVRVPRTVVAADGRREHAAATHVRLAEAVGGVSDGLDARIAVAPAARAPPADALLARRGAHPARTIGLIAAGTWPTRDLARIARGRARAPPARRQARRAADRGPGRETCDCDARAAGPSLRVLPRCDVAEMVAVIQRGSGRSWAPTGGPRRVAAALGIPTAAWFSPTHPDNWNPPGERHGHWFTPLPCRGCDRTQCPQWSCLPTLAPEHAAGLVLEHLGRHAAAFGPAARA